METILNFQIIFLMIFKNNLNLRLCKNTIFIKTALNNNKNLFKKINKSVVKSTINVGFCNILKNQQKLSKTAYFLLIK